MTNTDRKAMLENVAKQAYLMGIDDAPSIMGRRGREKQLLKAVDSDNYELAQIPWGRVKIRLAHKVDFSFENEPNESL